MTRGGSASNFWRLGLEPSGAGVSRVVMASSSSSDGASGASEASFGAARLTRDGPHGLTVTFKMRWVTSGGTPWGEPCWLICWTTGSPDTTWPNSEYWFGSDSPWAPVTMKNWASPVWGRRRLAMATEPTGYCWEGLEAFGGYSSAMV